jgi:hypothetical protein
VADALARRETLSEQLDAQREYVAAEQKRWMSQRAAIRPARGLSDGADRAAVAVVGAGIADFIATNRPGKPHHLVAVAGRRSLMVAGRSRPAYGTDQYGKTLFLICAILGLLTAIGPLCSDFYLPALPEIATHLHTSTTLTQLSLTSALIGLGLGQLFRPAERSHGA